MVFKSLRKYMKTIMWGIAIIIVPAFVLWNVGSAIRNRKSGYSGELYGKRVPWNDFFQAKQASRNSAWLKYGDKLDQFVNLDEQTWTRLILLKEAKKRRISVNKDELLTFIKALPIFQYAPLTPESYAPVVARLFQQTPAEFEKGMKDSLLMDKLIAEVTSEIKVTDSEIKELYISENEQASATYVIVESDNFINTITTDNEDALKNYYEKNKQQFETQPKVLADYVEIKLDQFKSTINISPEKIEKYYNKNKSKYLIDKDSTPSTDTNESNNDTESKYKPLEQASDSIKDKLIEKGMNDQAAALARRIMNKLYTDVSLTTAATENGLTVEKTGPFSMSEEIPNIGLNFHFLKAAFSLEVGDISEIIISPAAYYILMPTKKIAPYIAEYEAAVDQVKQEYKKSEAQKLAQKKAGDILKKIEQSVQEKQISFEEAAKELTLETKKAEKFTRSGYISSLGFAAEFTKTAFALTPGEISEVVKSSRGFCVLTTDEIAGFDEQHFNSEKKRYKEKVLTQKKNTFLTEWFEKLKTAADPKSYLDENNQP